MSRKRWEDMTFEEKMASVEDDFEHSRASQVQQKMLSLPEKSEWTHNGESVPNSAFGQWSSSVPNVQHISRQSAESEKKHEAIFKDLMKKIKENNIKVVMPIHDELIVEAPADYADRDSLLTTLLFDLETVRGPEQEMTLTVLKHRDPVKKDPEDEEQLSVRLPHGKGGRSP